MKTNEVTVKVDQKACFSLANKIRGQKHCDMKTAYAEAKAQLIAEAAKAVKKEKAAPKAKKTKDATATTTRRNIKAAAVGKPTDGKLTAQEFISMLEKGSVKFTYRNSRGKVHTTKGTLDPSLITSRVNVKGAKTAKHEGFIAFYDRLHGVYCSVRPEDVIELF